MSRNTPNWSFNKFVFALTVMISLAGVFILDYNTGTEISFSIFYLVPICFAVWYLGKTEGILVSLTSAGLWYVGETRILYSHESIPLWNAFVRFGFFLIVVFLLYYIKKFNTSLGTLIKERTSELTKEIAERKRAEEEVSTKNIQLSQLAMNIQKVKEEENIRVAREIHDELGQMLSALKIELSRLNITEDPDDKNSKRLASINLMLEDTIKTVRKISTHLRPRLLEELGLFPAIEMQVREFQTRTGIRCILKLPENTIELDKNTSLAIFRIFQEAMTNISRHANATNVHITAIADTDSFILEIKDNGIGIYNNFPFDENSLGILGMKERAHLLNGEAVIKGVPEGGTFVKVNIPINNNPKK